MQLVEKLSMLRTLLLLAATLLLGHAGATGSNDGERPSQPCSPVDRAALLAFKSGITVDTTGILATWVGDDCCGAWEGVSCDAATGRVTALLLQAPPKHYMEGLLSPSLGRLEFLETMVIRDMGRIRGAIPRVFSRLTRLRQLYLEGNMLSSRILESLGKMSSLQYLSLAGNRLEGQLPPELGAVPGLEQINLAHNRLVGGVPPSYGNLSRLACLDLSNNILSGAVTGFLGQLKSLALLDLSNNSFSGEIPASLRALRNLTDLSLSHNKLGGRIPPQIGSIQSLNSLAIDDNLLVGSIPESLLGLQKLWFLNLSTNGLSGSLPSEIRNGLPSSVSMDLSHNHLTGGIDQFFRSLSATRRANLPHKNVTSPIVFSLGLQHLDLSDNKITGALPDFANSESMKWLDVSNNAIGGQMPGSLSKLRGLERLDISRNRVRGVIPATMATMASLQWIDLSSNVLIGRIPENFTRLAAIRHVSFRGNKLCGQIPQTGPFNRFSAAAYAHNLCLCGKPLPPCRKIGI